MDREQSDESAISLDLDHSDSEVGSPSGWLQTHRGHDELTRIISKRKAGEKLLRGSHCFRLLEELVTTERNFVMHLQACADSYETPMRQSHLLHSASPGLVDLLFADLRDVRRLHIGFLNELEEVWDDEFSRLETLRVEGVPLEQLHMRTAPFVELIRSMLEGPAFTVAYTHWYATPLEERQRPLHRLVQKDSAVRAMIDQLKRSSGKDVPFFLRLPLRVLPRYNLLLDALAKEVQRRGSSSDSLIPDPTATAARQLVAHLERSEKSMSHMGDAIEVARSAVCRSVHLDILQSSDLPTEPSSNHGKYTRGTAQHIVEARVVTIRNADSGDHGQRSKSEKLALSSDSAGSDHDATAVDQPSWTGDQASGEICKGLGTFGESRLVLKYLRKTRGSKAELIGRAELWLDISLPHLHWVGWLPWEAGANGAYGTGAPAGLGAIKLSVKVDIPLDPTVGTAEKLKLLSGLHAQICFGRNPRLLDKSDGNDRVADSKLTKQVSNRSSSPTVEDSTSDPANPRLRTDEERVIIHLEVQLAVLEEELERKTKAQTELRQRAANSEAEKEEQAVEIVAMKAELEQLRAQVLTRSSSLASVHESVGDIRTPPKRRGNSTDRAPLSQSPSIPNVSAVEELHRTLSQLREAQEQRNHEATMLSGSQISPTTSAVEAKATEAARRLREAQAQLAAAEGKVESLSRAVVEAESEAFAERKTSAALRTEILRLQQQLRSMSTQSETQSQRVAELRVELSDLRKQSIAKIQHEQRKHDEALLALQRSVTTEPSRATGKDLVPFSTGNNDGIWLTWLAPLRRGAADFGFSNGSRGNWFVVAGGVVVVLLAAVARARRGRA